MRRILLAIWFYVFFVAFALAQNTTLTGTMTAPGGQPFTGYLWLSLSQVAISLSACGTPTYVLPNIPLEINVVNGNLIGTYVIWGDDCLNPSGDPYNVQIKDLNGNVLVTDQWLIQGSTFDVGTAVSALDNPIATSTGSGGGGTLGIGGGGTGATTAAGALANLGGLPLTGGTLTGALNGTSASFSGNVAMAGSLAVAGSVTASAMLSQIINGIPQADQFPGADFGAKLQACLGTVSSVYGGTCDARNFTGTVSMGSNLTISTANVTVLLPCATISTANQVIVTAGTRNVTLRGCALRGASTASGSQGGTVFFYSGSGAMVQVGDPTYAADTQGFHMDNAVINTTASSSATAQGLAAYRTQEMDLASLYFLGNSNQTGMTLDGTGNYTGGTFFDNAFNGFQTAVNAIGHQIANAATTDWLNASTFVRLHIDCPTSGGNPVSGSYGINLQQGDGNTFTGGDVEGCATALHLGANAQNNTIVGLRNENSTNQVIADSGSQYNSWITGGTMFTGKLTDNGTHNSFADTFHRSWNNLNGDLWRSQSDATITNNVYTGIGLGHVRGRIQEWQTDVPGSPGSYQNVWLWGPGDGTTGLQLWQLEDELNNVTRFGVQQYTTAGGNNQSFLNAAGTGSVCFNCSTNSGTGGISIGSGGATPTTVWNSDSSGNIYQLGRQDFYSASTLAWRLNCASTSACNIDSETPTANAHHIRLYNGAGTDIDSESAGGVTINNSTGGGTGPFTVYGGGATYYNTKLFQVQNNGNGTANYLLPSLAAGSGNYCLQADTSGYVTNTGQACGTGSGSGSVTSVGLSLPAQFSVANSPVTNSGTLTATWVSQAGHSFLAGLDSSSTGTPAFRAIAADDVPTLNQSTSGNAATATASDHSPTQCSSGLYSQGDTTGWAANCATVQYSQLGGSVPTWNQNTTGTAAGITQAASIHIDNSAGANYVCINCDNNTGTSGFVVQNGTGSSPTTEFQVNGSGNTTATGFLASKGWFGNYAATFTAGAAAGSSPTIGCLSGHTCTNIQGTVSIHTGTATTTGTIVTVNFNHTQNNDLDCATDFQLAGTGHLTTYDATSSTSGLVIATDGFTPAASTTYTLTYVCGSY
jgi:hypothetical protein